jgi:hypothetical protein
MKITIESTDTITILDGVHCRVWRGITERGAECELAIPSIRVPAGSDAAELEAELCEMQGPFVGLDSLKFW